MGEVQQWFGACNGENRTWIKVEIGDTDAISEVIEEMKAAVEDIVLECSYERFQDIYGSICFDSKHIENEYSDDESYEEGDYTLSFL